MNLCSIVNKSSLEMVLRMDFKDYTCMKNHTHNICLRIIKYRRNIDTHISQNKALFIIFF